MWANTSYLIFCGYHTLISNWLVWWWLEPGCYCCHNFVLALSACSPPTTLSRLSIFVRYVEYCGGHISYLWSAVLVLRPPLSVSHYISWAISGYHGVFSPKVIHSSFLHINNMCQKPKLTHFLNCRRFIFIQSSSLCWL